MRQINKNIYYLNLIIYCLFSLFFSSIISLTNEAVTNFSWSSADNKCPNFPVCVYDVTHASVEIVLRKVELFTDC